MATNIEMNILKSDSTYETLYPKTSTSNLKGTLSSSQLPSSIPASNISGTLSTSNIPNLSASKITSGTLGTARIPSLDASKITSGTLPANLGGTGVKDLSSLGANISDYIKGTLKQTFSLSGTCSTSSNTTLGTVSAAFLRKTAFIVFELIIPSNFKGTFSGTTSGRISLGTYTSGPVIFYFDILNGSFNSSVTIPYGGYISILYAVKPYFVVNRYETSLSSYVKFYRWTDYASASNVELYSFSATSSSIFVIEPYNISNFNKAFTVSVIGYSF